MFDTIVNRHRTGGRRGLAPLMISWAVHTLAIGALVLVPLLFAAERLPEVPKEAVAYIRVAAPPPSPPPPPPAAPAAASAVRRSAPQPAPTARPARVAPVQAPRELPTPSVDAAESGAATADYGHIAGVIGGVPGGVPGGLPGGVIGGVLGGIPDVAPQPPPPAAPRPPVRTGGQVKAPALIKRVPPTYPPSAVRAKVEGVVILEATVGRDGQVEDVAILRSVPLLDKAAMDAVRQWEYAPLLLNGEAQRFVLTVTVNFSLS
jgi:protein TonB